MPSVLVCFFHFRKRERESKYKKKKLSLFEVDLHEVIHLLGKGNLGVGLKNLKDVWSLMVCNYSVAFFFKINPYKSFLKH